MASTSRRARRNMNLSGSPTGSIDSEGNEEQSEVDQKVRAILNYILSHSANKVPIKFTDLVQLVDNRKELLNRIPLVTDLLKERYGVQLVELEGTPKRYICLAEAPPSSIHELTSAQRPQFTMLHIILTYIFLRGNRIEEDKLYAMLEELGISVHEEHSYFGSNIQKMIDDTFVKQQYLKRDRSQLSPYDDPKNYYSWGLRAKAEFSYRKLVEFASVLFDQDVSFFQQQLLMAESIDNPEALQQLTLNANNADNSYIDVNEESLDVNMDIESQ